MSYVLPLKRLLQGSDGQIAMVNYESSYESTSKASFQRSGGVGLALLKVFIHRRQ